MRIDDLNAPYGEFVARAPTSVFPRGVNRTRPLGIHAVCDFTDPAIAATAVTAPAGVGQKSFFPEPSQPQALNLGTTATTVPAAHNGSAGVAAENVLS